jgi:hypothetical protein
MHSAATRHKKANPRAVAARRIHGVWLRSYSRGFSVLAGVLACWLCAVPARAAPPSATAADTAADDSGSEPPDFELGLRAFFGDSGDVYVGAIGFTFEALLMASPHYGFGASFSLVHVDNGSDPHYSSRGTLQDGQRFLAFAEADLFDFPITPYARLGLGGGPTTRWDGSGEKQGGADFMAEASAGAVARLGPLALRLFASPSLFGPDLVLVYGVGLGGHFPVRNRTPSTGGIEP